MSPAPRAGRARLPRLQRDRSRPGRSTSHGRYPAMRPAPWVPTIPQRSSLRLQCLALADRALPQLALEGAHLLADLRREGVVALSEDAGRQQAGVAGSADGDGGHGNSGGHLHDRQQRVQRVEVLERDGHADHGQGGEGGEHAGEVGRASGSGDDHAQAAVGGGAAPGDHVLRHAVGGDHIDRDGDVELGERLLRGPHHRVVGVGSHHDAHQGAGGAGGHRLSSVLVAAVVVVSSVPAPGPWMISCSARCARCSNSSVSWPISVTWPILRPGRTALPYRWTFSSGSAASAASMPGTRSSAVLPRRLTMTAAGATGSTAPRGRSATARTCCSNWPVTAPSMDQCPVLWGRIASSLTSTRPSAVSNNSTASIPTTSRSSAMSRASCWMRCWEAWSSPGARATPSAQPPSRWTDCTTGYAALCPPGRRATCAESSRVRGTSSSASSSRWPASQSSASPALLTIRTPWAS